jgi:hypothetical protein
MHSASKVINEQIFEISPRDREILRGLAARVAEVASRPIEAEKRELWYRHNSLVLLCHKLSDREPFAPQAGQ